MQLLVLQMFADNVDIATCCAISQKEVSRPRQDPMCSLFNNTPDAHPSVHIEDLAEGRMEYRFCNENTV